MVGSDEVEGDFLRSERHKWLPILIPPLVHRLNNSLLVVGNAGALPDDPEATAENASEFARLGSSLRWLSQFAKQHRSNAGSFALDKLIEGLRYLAEPLADECGVTLDFRVPAGSWMLEGSLYRMHQWLLTGLLEWIHALRARGERRDVAACLRLSVNIGPRGAELSLAGPFLNGMPEALTPTFHSAFPGLHARIRQVGAARALRMRLAMPAGSQPSAPLATAHKSAPKPRLTLVLADQGLRSLIRDFLEGEGFRVQALGDASGLTTGGPDAGVLILDLASLRLAGGLRRRLETDLGSLKRVILLGEAIPGELTQAWSRVPQLPTPLKPAQLLAQVQVLF